MDWSQLKLPNQKQSPSIMRSISWMWVLTGVILIIVGLWSGVVYFILSPYRENILQNSGGNESYAKLLSVIDYLPLFSLLLVVLAVANIWSGFAFRRFKEWALKSIQVLSYIMLFLSGIVTVFWVKVWMFSFDFAPSGGVSQLWQYVGLFTGLFASLFYIGILIYFIRAIRMKPFREAYSSKTIV